MSLTAGLVSAILAAWHSVCGCLLRTPVSNKLARKLVGFSPELERIVELVMDVFLKTPSISCATTLRDWFLNHAIHSIMCWCSVDGESWRKIFGHTQELETRVLLLEQELAPLAR